MCKVYNMLVLFPISTSLTIHWHPGVLSGLGTTRLPEPLKFCTMNTVFTTITPALICSGFRCCAPKSYRVVWGVCRHSELAICPKHLPKCSQMTAHLKATLPQSYTLSSGGRNFHQGARTKANAWRRLPNWPTFGTR